MTVESATYINGLNASNPGSTDLKAEGDDHIRLLKAAVKATFPNVTGAVTPTQAELNYVAGVTSAIQTQLSAKAGTASPTFTGTVTAPTFAGNLAGNVTGNASTATTATNLFGGTVGASGSLSLDGAIVAHEGGGATVSSNLPIGSLMAGGAIGIAIPQGATQAMNGAHYIETAGPSGVAMNIQYGTWRCLGRTDSTTGVYLWVRVA